MSWNQSVQTSEEVPGQLVWQFYFLPQSVAMSYLEILQRFAGRHILGDSRWSRLPSIHWETGYCIRALEKGRIRESVIEKNVLSMSTEFNIKIKLTAPCRKTIFSKELENKERLQLKFFTSLQHCQAKWKANGGKKNVGFPGISLQDFRDSVLWQTLKKCLFFVTHLKWGFRSRL